MQTCITGFVNRQVRSGNIYTLQRKHVTYLFADEKKKKMKYRNTFLNGGKMHLYQNRWPGYV